MGSGQTKLKKALNSILEPRAGGPQAKAEKSGQNTETPTALNKEESKAVNIEDYKAQKAQLQDSAEPKPSSKPAAPKANQPGKTSKGLHKIQQALKKDEAAQAVEARKIQMMTRPGEEPSSSSPLQIHLIRSESLRAAQEKIMSLEEELSKLRAKNEAIVSASELLKDKNDKFKSKIEDLKFALEEEKNNFNNEKEVILTAMEEAKSQINKLKRKKAELDSRLSRGLSGIRSRENSLESRIEILKMETSVLQREKDKKIIELKRQIQKIKNNLNSAHKKNQEMQTLNNKLQESSRRTVSALRAAIYNLEGVRSQNEETIATDAEEEK